MTSAERIKEARTQFILAERKLWLAAIRDHARQNYEKGGWDYIIECWSDHDIAKAIGTAKTLKGAIWNVSRVLKAMDDYRADIQAEAF